MLNVSNKNVRTCVAVLCLGMIIFNSSTPGMAFKGPIRKALSAPKSDGKPIKHETKQPFSGEIPCRSWYRSDRMPYAALLCLHGFGMDMNSYDQFGKHMSELGIPTYAIDVRGFGCWQDNQKHELDFDGAIRDVQTALIAVRKVHPDVPLILLGESMGGSLALQAMAENQTLADGLICSVPGDDRFGEKGVDLKVAIGILTGSRKSIKVGNGIVNQITDDPKLRNELKSDPKARLEYSAKELVRFQKFMDQVDDAARKITSTPVLFLQGGSDQLVKPKGTVQAFKSMPTKDKDFLLIGTSEHLILEAGQLDDNVTDVLTSWLYKHVVAKNQQKYLAAKSGLPPSDFKLATGHLRIGQGLIELGELKKARAELLLALSIGRGTPIALIAVQILAGLAEPNLFQTGQNSTAQFVTHAEAMANAKPSVIFFGARWIDPSYELNTVIQSGLKRYGDRVNFVRVDTDDPQNQSLIDGYGVRLVPSVVFLDGQNQVAGIEIGSLSERALFVDLARIAMHRLSSPLGEKSDNKAMVVLFGQPGSAAFQHIEATLVRMLAPFTANMDLVKVDSEKPQGAELLKQYGTNQLPVTMFLNSGHDVVTYTTGDASDDELRRAFLMLIAKKEMPIPKSP